MPGPLGRRPPTDDEHIRKYPLTVAALPQLPVPVVLGINWYEAFDDPVRLRDRRWWIGVDDQGRARSLGAIRGGHAVCLKPAGVVDSPMWWAFYDQGQEGACVGFAASRTMSLLNRKRYAASWLYREAQKIDEWPGENYEGTSVRAAMDILRDHGHSRTRTYGGQVYVDAPDPTEGIQHNRWATSVEEVLTCIQSPYYERLGAVAMLNSWGRLRDSGRKGYPHLVHIPVDILARLLREDGEATILTDR